MLLTKLRMTMAVMLMVGAMTTAAGLAGHHALQARPPDAKRADTGRPDPDQRAALMADREKLQGTWTVVSAERLGKKVGPIIQIAYAFNGDKVTCKNPMGQETNAFRLYPNQTPKAIDLTSESGTTRGIYKLSDDTLTLSIGWGPRAKVRPVDFDGDGLPVVFVLKKTKPPEGTPPKVLDVQPAKPPVEEPAVVFENSPGWSWYDSPRERHGFGSSGATSDIFDSGYSYFFEEDKEGALLVYLAFSTNKSVTSYRPVIFDADRKRYLLKPTGGLGHRGVSMTRFRLDPEMLPASKAVYLGIEILTAKGRKLLAKEAFDRARKSGAELLPFPEIGAAYDFVLTTADGRIIRSNDLRGKVVLIDCWATWCSPCMAKMPQLKELYEQHRKNGLEIVGICFDQDADQARKAIKSGELNWPHVLVPGDKNMRGLWEEASGIEVLPRLLLLDRSGVLRVDCGPGELKEQIDKLLKETENADSRR